VIYPIVVGLFSIGALFLLLANRVRNEVIGLIAWVFIIFGLAGVAMIYINRTVFG
jgi:hypothetical protein